ncbi:MAG: DUF2818 family protein [Sulfuricella denitrificans]|nr:DUF2818 family protein [Sulfuricella denitrificans]
MAILLVLALVAANLPFVADRLLLLIPLKSEKSLIWHLFELMVLYFMVGGVSVLLERRLAPPHSQNWEFYAVTACLFLVFAFPGFIYRYLWRKR